MAMRELQLIAKLSGSFAVAGFVADQLSLECIRNALPAQILSILLPKRSHAFALSWPKARITESERAKTFHALDSDGRYRKIYPVELRIRSISSQFEVRTLSMALLRAVVATYAPVIDEYFKDLQRLEKEAEDDGREVDWEELPLFDWQILKDKSPLIGLAMARDIVVGIVRILLSWGAVRYLDSQLVWKLVKDQTASVRAKRRHPFYKRPVIVTRTVLRSLVIGTLAECLVGGVIESVRIWISHEVPRHKKQQTLSRKLTARTLSLVVSMVSSSAAAGLVAVVHPGRVCIAASIAAGFATDVFICMPASTEYESTGRISRRTTVLLVACSGVLLWSFYPWLGLSRSSANLSVQPAFS